MARGRAHDEELRAQVMAALLAGEAVNVIARRYNLDKSIVSRIKSSISSEKLQQVATANEIAIDELIAKTLQAHLMLQLRIAEVASEPEYLRGQTATDLAKLLEVSQNHTIRLLEAASDAQEEEEEE